MSNHPHKGKVMTTAGPCEPSDLGVTLTHEHILLDIRNYWERPDDPEELAIAEEPLSLHNVGLARRRFGRIRDNLVLEDQDLAVEELGRFAELGGGTVVDVSSVGVRTSSYREIADVCRAAGLRCVVASGYYVHDAHPMQLAEQSVESIAEEFVREMLEGVDGIQTGIIGEIGIGQPGHPDEWKVLEAACRAQLETGVPLCVHPYFGNDSRVAPEVTRFVLEKGVDPRRFNLCHMDGYMDIDYQRRLLDMGVWISFDTFGLEAYFSTFNYTAHDAQRERYLLELLDLGYGDQLLLSQDVCTKMQTRAGGGLGYGHIVENIVPSLAHAGVEDHQIDRLLVENPATYMTIA